MISCAYEESTRNVDELSHSSHLISEVGAVHPLSEPAFSVPSGSSMALLAIPSPALNPPPEAISHFSFPFEIISFILSSYSYSGIFLLTFLNFWKELNILTISTFFSPPYQQSSLPAPHSTETAVYTSVISKLPKAFSSPPLPRLLSTI